MRRQKGLRLHMAFQVLANCCATCWVQGLEYQSHRSMDCQHSPPKMNDTLWNNWKLELSFPVGVCFFCCFPLKVSWVAVATSGEANYTNQMTYMMAGQEIRVHAHPCDKTCHWSDILKPIAFTVISDSDLCQVFKEMCQLDGRRLDHPWKQSAGWLCHEGEGGNLNILNLFLLMLDLRGPPSIHHK